MYRGVLALACLGAASAFAPSALLPTRAARATAAKATQGLSMQRFSYADGNDWDVEGLTGPSTAASLARRRRDLGPRG
jgi:hypothetical protein